MSTRKEQRLRTVVALVAALACGAGAPALAAKFKDPRTMKIPPLGEIRSPDIDRHVLENGIVVLLVEDHQFPLVDYSAMIRVGSMYEPEALRGLAEITGEVLRTGGTASLPGDELDEHLESIGAYIESNIGSTDGSVAASFLREDAAEGLRLMADVMRNPAFPEEKIELAKVSQRTEIASRNDEPIPIAIREFRKLMAGEHSPYGWYPEYETIEAITRDHLVEFHRRFFQPTGMIITASGDFDRSEMLGLIQQTFGSWPASGEALPPDPPVPPKGPTGVFHAEKGGITQSTVLFGLRGTLASDPDYAALRLLNDILGGGEFASRLMNEIRTKRGLAYAVGSQPGSGFHHPGVWVCYLLTQADSTLTGAGIMRREVERIVTEPVTDEELRQARDAVLNQLVFDLSSKREVLNRRALYEFYGYPEDFLEQFQEKVRTLTPADLRAAAQRHIRPEEMAVVVVGPRADFDAPLEELGRVTEIDITIPEPPSKLEIPEPTAEALEAGAAILDAAYAAHGGAALAKVTSVREEGKGSMSAMGQQMSFTLTVLRQFPDRNYAKILIGGMFEILQVVDGDTGWSKSPQGVNDQSPAEVEEARADRIRSPFYFLPKRRELTWQALEQMEVDGVLCDVVHGRHEQVKEWILYFDAETHRLHAMDYRGMGRGGPVAVREIESDYRPVDGVEVAYATRSFHDGEPFIETQMDKIAFNVPVDASLFARP